MHNPVGQTIIANDFVIPYRNSEQADAHRGRHFQIWFDVYSKQYFIKDLGIGFGVFKKMQNGSAILKDNHLINVGEAYIVVNILSGNLLAQDTDLQQHHEGNMNNEMPA